MLLWDQDLNWTFQLLHVQVLWLLVIEWVGPNLNLINNAINLRSPNGSGFFFEVGSIWENCIVGPCDATQRRMWLSSPSQHFLCFRTLSILSSRSQEESNKKEKLYNFNEDDEKWRKIKCTLLVHDLLYTSLFFQMLHVLCFWRAYNFLQPAFHYSNNTPSSFTCFLMHLIYHLYTVSTLYISHMMQLMRG